MDIHASHRHQEFIAFLEKTDDATDPKLDLHMILDNLQTHKTPEVRTWLDALPRFYLHFIPTSSWLNSVDRLFRDLTSQSLKRGVSKNGDALEASLVRWLEARNDNPKPYSCIKTVEEILRKVRKYKRISETLH